MRIAADLEAHEAAILEANAIDVAAAERRQPRSTRYTTLTLS